MNNKKNIDRLFQEGFKDFESIPDSKVWNHIHDALHEKKKRRVIPWWWKLSGIAAGFVLGFLAISTFSTTFDIKPAVVNAPKEIENTNPTIKSGTPKTETRIVIESEEASLKENNSKEDNYNATETTKNKIATDNTNSSAKENDAGGNLNQDSRNKTKIIPDVKTKKGKNQTFKNTVVANNSEKNQIQNKAKGKSTSEEAVIVTTVAKSDEKNAVARKDFTTEAVEILNANNSSTEKGTVNGSLQEKDSTALAVAKELNPLEEILRKKNEKAAEVLAIAKLNRWQVTTNVAPIYFNSASNGSPIESQFAENSKTYENNLSVGVGVQYAVNKKVSLRTGVNKMTLGYGTNDIMFFSALEAQVFKTLNVTDMMSNIELISANNSVALRPFEDNLQNMERGVLNQRMGYYEVPLELSFAVVNSKFGVNVIGGVSTLFLNENSVSIQSETATMNLGQANNLNNIHFSSNIGVGFKYEFWKSFEARFEPTFKYQFNTFTRDAGNFRPYFVGLYSGVSYRF